MTLSEQSALILSALESWADDTNGRAYIASDPADVLDQIRARPGTPTAAVLWTGEEPIGQYPEEGKVLRSFKIVISRGRSLNLISGESLTQGASGGPALFDLLEQARETVLAIRIQDQPGELQLPIYKGSSAFEVQNFLLDALEIRQDLYAQIPPQS